MLAMLWSAVGLLTVVVDRTWAQASYPHVYPGMPSGDFSPQWQNYFQVTEALPNVSFPLNRNWAGNIPVDRPGHPNNTLFFWAFEKENGSLTAAAGERSDEPWGIWLNGGPGSSSMVGLLFENGPIHIRNDYSVFSNNFSWHQLADYIWVDQPVGTGWSTAEANAFVNDEDQMAEDFFGFLSNLVKVFPSLSTRPFYLTGESYAGTYIPYITKGYFGMSNPPVKLTKIAMGDGSIGSIFEFELMPVLTVIETYPQLIGYDPDVYTYFKEQSHLCGYDLNLTYPQNGHFPTLNPPGLSGSGALSMERARKKTLIKQALKVDAHIARRDLSRQQRDWAGSIPELTKRREQWKRDLSGRANGTIDSTYGCDLYFEMIDYALNYSFPWMGHDYTGFDVYDIPDALDPEAPMDASVFSECIDDTTRAAMHAPTSKDWAESINYEFGGPNGNDPSVEPMAFLTDLATNATAQGVGVLIYSGNDDSLVSHRSSEVVIQNTTFGGIQGFTRKPSTPWLDDNGQFAGIVHQERNWTFVLVADAGHLVPQQQPGRAFVMAREFILGSNQTGLVTNSSGVASVVGGESPSLTAEVLSGQSGIYIGTGTTQSTYTFPSATIAAWESFIATGPTGGSTSCVRASAYRALRTLAPSHVRTFARSHAHTPTLAFVRPQAQLNLTSHLIVMFADIAEIEKSNRWHDRKLQVIRTSESSFRIEVPRDWRLWTGWLPRRWKSYSEEWEEWEERWDLASGRDFEQAAAFPELKPNEDVFHVGLPSYTRNQRGWYHIKPWTPSSPSPPIACQGGQAATEADVPPELFDTVLSPMITITEDIREWTRRGTIEMTVRELGWLSLVCRHWAGILRPRIFSAITLRSRNDVDTLLSFTRNPRSDISKYIQFVYLSQPLTQYPYVPWTHTVSVRDIRDLKGDHIIVQMTLNGPLPAGKTTKGISEMLPRYIPCSFRGIRRLKLCNLHFKKVGDLVHIPRELPSLELMFCEDVTWDPSFDEMPKTTPFLGGMPRVERIDYDVRRCTDNGVAGWFLILLPPRWRDRLEQSDAHTICRIASALVQHIDPTEFPHHKVHAARDADYQWFNASSTLDSRRTISMLITSSIRVYYTQHVARQARRVRAIVVDLDARALFNVPPSLAHTDWKAIDRHAATLQSLQTFLICCQYRRDVLLFHKEVVMPQMPNLRYSPKLKYALHMWLESSDTRHTLVSCTDNKISHIVGACAVGYGAFTACVMLNSRHKRYAHAVFRSIEAAFAPADCALTSPLFVGLQGGETRIRYLLNVHQDCLINCSLITSASGRLTAAKHLASFLLTLADVIRFDRTRCGATAAAISSVQPHNAYSIESIWERSASELATAENLICDGLTLQQGCEFVSQLLISRGALDSALDSYFSGTSTQRSRGRLLHSQTHFEVRRNPKPRRMRKDSDPGPVLVHLATPASLDLQCRDDPVDHTLQDAGPSATSHFCLLNARSLKWTIGPPLRMSGMTVLMPLLAKLPTRSCQRNTSVSVCTVLGGRKWRGICAVVDKRDAEDVQLRRSSRWYQLSPPLVDTRSALEMLHSEQLERLERLDGTWGIFTASVWQTRIRQALLDKRRVRLAHMNPEGVPSFVPDSVPALNCNLAHLSAASSHNTSSSKSTGSPLYYSISVVQAFPPTARDLSSLFCIYGWERAFQTVSTYMFRKVIERVMIRTCGVRGCNQKEVVAFGTILSFIVVVHSVFGYCHLSPQHKESDHRLHRAHPLASVHSSAQCPFCHYHTQIKADMAYYGYLRTSQTSESTFSIQAPDKWRLWSGWTSSKGMIKNHLWVGRELSWTEGLDPMDVEGFDDTTAFPALKPNAEVFHVGVPTYSRKQRGWYHVKPWPVSTPVAPSANDFDAATGSDVPVELLEKMLRYVDLNIQWAGHAVQMNKRDIGWASLVCSRWADILRPRIFKTITLRNRGDVITLSSFVIHPLSHVAKYIEDIMILQSLTQYPYQPWTHTLSTIHRPNFPKRWTSLVLSGPLPTGSFTKGVCEMLPRSVPWQFSGIAYLQLSCLHFQKAGDLLRLPRDLPSLQFVDCRNVTWDNSPSDEMPPMSSYLSTSQVNGRYYPGIRYTLRRCTDNLAAVWFATLLAPRRRDSLEERDAYQICQIASALVQNLDVAQSPDCEVKADRQADALMFHVQGDGGATVLTPYVTVSFTQQAAREARRVRSIKIETRGAVSQVVKHSNWGAVDALAAALPFLEIHIITSGPNPRKDMLYFHQEVVIKKMPNFLNSTRCKYIVEEGAGGHSRSRTLVSCTEDKVRNIKLPLRRFRFLRPGIWVQFLPREADQARRVQTIMINFEDIPVSELLDNMQWSPIDGLAKVFDRGVIMRQMPNFAQSPRLKYGLRAAAGYIPISFGDNRARVFGGTLNCLVSVLAHFDIDTPTGMNAYFKAGACGAAKRSIRSKPIVIKISSALSRRRPLLICVLSHSPNISSSKLTGSPSRTSATVAQALPPTARDLPPASMLVACLTENLNCKYFVRPARKLWFDGRTAVAYRTLKCPERQQGRSTLRRIHHINAFGVALCNCSCCTPRRSHLLHDGAVGFRDCSQLLAAFSPRCKCDVETMKPRRLAIILCRLEAVAWDDAIWFARRSLLSAQAPLDLGPVSRILSYLEKSSFPTALCAYLSSTDCIAEDGASRCYYRTQPLHSCRLRSAVSDNVRRAGVVFADRV
ncbi:hypothetical protein NM688_g126 [Phlebia brevispora]|uniref:Uncharacterized protein n=1 Tax=Phlebia brevispora TaxID=194682 RepID=A0ACC1TF88_9APHY|nr:hypothetical protein NM688_g126 [Phlebia brevispora]